MFDAGEFRQGACSEAYRYLGAHPDGQGFCFAVWAPNARSVSVVGDFNGWDAGRDAMLPDADGIWRARLPLACGQRYKYAVVRKDGETQLKADPYAFAAELRPGTASLTCDLNYQWRDAAHMRARGGDFRKRPILIYEVHLGSFKRAPDGGFLSYARLADELIRHVRKMGFTHIELLPVTEHPLDASWGYQTTGYFAATARFGPPRAFMEFVDRFHQAGIGVFLDWVPGHFAKDAFGLRRFDGTGLYEDEDPRRGDHPQWGTHQFNFERGEVRSFLLSSARFWLEKYHIDGIRVDAVSSMLYHSYGRSDYLPNRYGGEENLGAVDFLRGLNAMAGAEFPGALMMAEEATSWPMVTKPPYLGGLGFHLKWNMGWMNDVLDYMKRDPIHRRYHHNKMTFSMVYAFTENFVLPLSHDEVVHGKKSLLDKMPGDYWQKFAQLRALLCFQYAHPGKKLLFMGTELGMFIEWRYAEELEWHLLSYEMHEHLFGFIAALNRFYRGHPALYAQDDGWQGMRWLNADDNEHSVFSFLRSGGGGQIVCVFNFTPVAREEYRVALPMDGTLEEIFSSDHPLCGGSGVLNGGPVRAEPYALNTLPYSAAIRVPPLGASFFNFIPSGKDRALPERI